MKLLVRLILCWPGALFVYMVFEKLSIFMSNTLVAVKKILQIRRRIYGDEAFGQVDIMLTGGFISFKKELVYMGNSIPDESSEQKKRIKRYYYKNVNLFNIIERIKLWPSRTGLLHGVKTFTVKGNYAEIITHCNEKIIIKKSKNSRATRWLRNKWFTDVCPKCKVPLWKLEKYGTTSFNKHWGSQLSSEFAKIRLNGGEDYDGKTSKYNF